MTRWHVAMTHVISTLSVGFLGIVMGIIGVWTQSSKFGGTAAILLGVFAVSGIFGSMALYMDYGWPGSPNLGFKGRRALKREEQRIALTREIERLERQAGIR